MAGSYVFYRTHLWYRDHSAMPHDEFTRLEAHSAKSDSTLYMYSHMKYLWRCIIVFM